MRKVGFVGLGVMGGPMASNIARAGFSLTVNDARQDAMQTLTDLGANSMPLKELAEKCDDIILCLPDGDVVREVAPVFCKPGQMVIDMSTTHPDTSKEVAAALAERGVFFVDAPVTGERARAEAGTLTVMVGGDTKHFRRCLPILEAMSRKAVHVGEVGHGQLTKSINNCLYNVSVAAMAEVLPLATKLGLSPEAVAEVVQRGSGQSFGFDKFWELALERKFEAPEYGYPMKSAFKDMEVLRDMAERCNTELRVVGATETTYRKALESGLGSSHKGAMVQVWEAELGVVCKKV